MTTPRTFCYRVFPRLYDWALVALSLLVILNATHPQQMGVVLYKCALVTLGAVLGYWIDRSLFPYARPHVGMATCDGVPVSREPLQMTAAILMLRRAVIVFACILGLTMGM